MIRFKKTLHSAVVLGCGFYTSQRAYSSTTSTSTATPTQSFELNNPSRYLIYKHSGGELLLSNFEELCDAGKPPVYQSDSFITPN